MSGGSATLRQRLLTALRRAKRKHFVVGRLADRIDASRAEVESVLDGLEAEGEIVRSGKGRIALAHRLGCAVGRVQVGRRSRALVIIEDGGPPVALAAGRSRPAMHGDRVLVEIAPYTRRGLRAGQIRKVLERGTVVLVGELLPSAGGTVLRPRDSRYQLLPLVIDSPRIEPGTLVAAEIVEYPTSYRDGTVRIVDALGKTGTLAAEIDAVCRTLSIPSEFPADVEEAARACAALDDPPGCRRADLRNLLTVTIDPADAKDHDDAVAVETTGEGFRLTVSIADVSHYVHPGTAIDREAMERGNSVYFPGRCIPMLPEKLSGDVASLKPEVDRRAISVILEIAANGAVTSERFESSWVRSRRLLTYQEVQAILDGSSTVDPEIARTLRTMEMCASSLYSSRRERGALDLDLPEAEIEVDACGHPIAVRRRPRLFAHRIIEEFMLAANEAVARHLEAAGLAFLYRIHGAPEDRNVSDLVERLRALGIRLPHDGSRIRPGDLRAVIDRVRGKTFERVVNQLVLRAMQQARYSAHKQIHFGLASTCYTHFTSPIRRYPDLLTHRALRASLDGSGGSFPGSAFLEPLADLASRRERRAMEAERDITRAAGILLMQPHVGEIFSGTVVHVDRAGYVVELDGFFVEGFVPVGRLSNYHAFVSERMELHSRVSGSSIRLGDRARVRIVTANLGDRQLDFAPAEDR